MSYPVRAGARKGAVLVPGAGSAAAHIARGREVRDMGGGREVKRPRPQPAGRRRRSAPRRG